MTFIIEPKQFNITAGKSYVGQTRPTTTPAWLAGRVANKWMQPAGPTIASIDPALDPTINPNVGQSDPRAPWALSNSLAASTNDYSGGAMDEGRQRLGIIGGGHAGFFGNFWTSYDFDHDQIVPVIHGIPSGSIPKPCANLDANGTVSGLLSDGRPRQVHTYNLPLFETNGDLILMPGGYGNYTSGGGVTAEGYAFNTAVNDWDVSRSYVFPASANGNGGACLDTIRNVIWQITDNKIFKYDRTTRAGTYVYLLNAGGANYIKMILDPVRDLIVCFNQNNSLDGHTGFVFLLDPKNPTAGFKSITITGGSATNWATAGVAYDELRDRYLIWNGGGAVTILKPPATAPDTNAWVLSALTTDTSSVTPTASVVNGVYGRFAISKKYDFAVGVNRLDQRPFVLPLS